jgi:hypothetical protein
MTAMLDRPAARRQQHAQAQRRFRRRQRNGTLMIAVALEPRQVAKLAALRYLGECELEDRKRIAAALVALIDAIELEP